MNMFDKKEDENGFIRFCFSKRKIIIPVVLVCTLLAYSSSFFMTRRYVGRAMFFVPAEVTMDKMMENNQIGYDVEADRVLQIIGSEQVKDSVVKKFNLAGYFGIDTTEKEWPQRLDNIYRNRIVASRTTIMAVVIQAETKDPVLSSQIADYVMRCAERIRERMYRQNSSVAEETYRIQYERKKSEVDSLERAIAVIRGTAVTNYPLLSNTLISASGNNPKLEVLTQNFINENNQLNIAKLKYENARDVNTQPVSRFYVIDNGYPVYEPVHPKPFFLCGAAFTGSFFFMLAFFYLRFFGRRLSKTS